MVFEVLLLHVVPVEPVHALRHFLLTDLFDSVTIFEMCGVVLRYQKGLARHICSSLPHLPEKARDMVLPIV